MIEWHLNKVPSLKPFSETTISGKPYLRRDAREKITGDAQFAGDIRLPGMLYSKIVHPPAHGAKQVSIDTSVAERSDIASVFG